MKILFFLLLFPTLLSAQDLAGVWTGQIQTTESELHYELVIESQKDKIKGYGLTIFIFDGVENIGIKHIEIKRKKNMITLEDSKLIYDNFSASSKRVKLYANLYLKESSAGQVLSGTFTTRSLDFRYNNTHTGEMHLKKQSSTYPSKLLAKMEQLKNESITAQKPKQEIHKKSEEDKGPLTSVRSKQASVTVSPRQAVEIKASQPAAEIKFRTTEPIETVSFTSDSIILTLYDNGEIDGDTVSLILNDKVILAKQRLSTQVIRTVIQTSPDQGNVFNLIMYAENLGSIPPNTGLLILQDGVQRKEIRFSSDFKKNSAVILKRK